jgi:hypothetical protein
MPLRISTVRVIESGSTRILMVADISEYYVVVDGQRVHWTEYYLDRRLCLSCLGTLVPGDDLGTACKCGQAAP